MDRLVWSPDELTMNFRSFLLGTRRKRFSRLWQSQIGSKMCFGRDCGPLRDKTTPSYKYKNHDRLSAKHTQSTKKNNLQPLFYPLFPSTSPCLILRDDTDSPLRPNSFKGLKGKTSPPPPFFLQFLTSNGAQ
jgi:hypothetical protein